jgi:phosphoglycerate dehydrogenase-like enzyme
MWREARLRWSNDLRAESQSLLSSAIKILQVFEANVMSTPALDPSKHTPSKRAMRNARRLDILHRATVGIDDLYLQAARSQRYARALLRPSAPKKGVVEVQDQGHPQELHRALALRRTRKTTPMPLP